MTIKLKVHSRLELSVRVASPQRAPVAAPSAYKILRKSERHAHIRSIAQGLAAEQEARATPLLCALRPHAHVSYITTAQAWVLQPRSQSSGASLQSGLLLWA
jgi:hypothetical protein